MHRKSETSATFELTQAARLGLLLDKMWIRLGERSPDDPNNFPREARDSRWYRQDWDAHYRDLNVIRAYAELAGAGDDWDVIAASDLADSTRSLEGAREKLANVEPSHDSPQIDDQLRFAPEERGVVTEPNFRIISAARLPDAVLFQKALREMPDRWPSGLELAAALGSGRANSLLGKSERRIVDETKGLFRKRGSVYQSYLDAMGVLFDPADRQAPTFMKSAAWQAKSINTALAGWALARHTMVLHAKELIGYAGSGDDLPGLVEPAPGFFLRFGAVIRQTADFFSENEAFLTPPHELASLIEQWLKEAAEVEKERARIEEERKRRAEDTGAELANQTPEEAERDDEASNPKFAEYRRVSNALRGLFGAVPSEGTNEALESLVAALREPAQAEFVARGISSLNDRLTSRWRKLEQLCQQLEALAHKKLRGLEFTADEDEFIRKYGRELGWVMFYEANSWMSPRDDAPRVVDVISGDERSPLRGVPARRCRASAGDRRALPVEGPRHHLPRCSPLLSRICPQRPAHERRLVRKVQDRAAAGTVVA